LVEQAAQLIGEDDLDFSVGSWAADRFPRAVAPPEQVGESGPTAVS